VNLTFSLRALPELKSLHLRGLQRYAAAEAAAIQSSRHLSLLVYRY
jgi:hypothetical protein